MANIDLINAGSSKEEVDLRKKLIANGYYSAAIRVGRNFLYPGSEPSVLWVQGSGKHNRQAVLMIDAEAFINRCRKSAREMRKVNVYALLALAQGEKKTFDELMNELNSFYNGHEIADDPRVKESVKQGKRLMKQRQMEADADARERLEKENADLQDELAKVKEAGWMEKHLYNDKGIVPGVSEEVSAKELAKPSSSLDPKDYVKKKAS